MCNTIHKKIALDRHITYLTSLATLADWDRDTFWLFTRIIQSPGQSPAWSAGEPEMINHILIFAMSLLQASFYFISEDTNLFFFNSKNIIKY